MLTFYDECTKDNKINLIALVLTVPTNMAAVSKLK